MKKGISLLLVLTMVLSISTSVSALGNGQGKGFGDGSGTALDDDGDGIPNREDPDYEKNYKNQDEMKDDDLDGVPNGQDNDFEPLLDGTKEQKGNLNQLKTQIKSMREKNGDNPAIKDANAAVQGLKLMNQFTNSTLGRIVSQIASEYEQKYQQALSIEDKINQRSSFSRFLFGGDEKLADSLDEQVRENQELIKSLISQLDDASDEEKEFIMEQIDELKAECDRLEAVANEEADRKGLFKWW